MIGAELHHISGDAVEERAFAAEQRAQDQRLPRRAAQHEAHDELRHALMAARFLDRSVEQHAQAVGVVRDAKARIGDVDHRQGDAVAGESADEGVGRVRR